MSGFWPNAVPPNSLIPNESVATPPTESSSYIQTACELIPAIVSPNYVLTKADILIANLDFVQTACELIAGDRDYVKTDIELIVAGSDYVRSLGTLVDTNREYVRSLCTLIGAEHDFVQTACNLIAQVSPGIQSGMYPDDCFVKTSCWLISSVPGHTSIQMPGADIAEDFYSSVLAADLYDTLDLVKLDGISLLISSYAAGVISYQTRIRQWMRRVDEAPGGILTTVETQTKTLPTGEVVTTTTTTEQNKDVVTVTVLTSSSGNPARTRTTVTQTSSSGHQTTREITTEESKGIKRTIENKIVTTTPPDRENIQPIKVTTLDGVTHFQWIGTVNPNFVGGDEEGNTQTVRSESVIDGQINGSSIDSFGNNIQTQVVEELVTLPTGETRNTRTEITGTTGAGTTTTDTETEFQGINKTTTTKVIAPDGAETTTIKEESLLSGDSEEVTIETVTDEFGQTTVTTTTVRTVTNPDTGVKTITTTIETSAGESTRTEITVSTPGGFDDDIVNKKIKVIFIQEFNITCVADEFVYQALLEKQIRHQAQYAKLELFTQMMSSANLSFDMRASLNNQFNLALDELYPMPFQALGKTYEVVFAPSASAFRAKYITGPRPHVYELQLILQQRADLVLGTNAVPLLSSGSSGDSIA